jgi:Peptidase family M28
MIDARLYRVSIFPAIVAVTAMLFSLQGVPAAVEAPVSLSGFDAQAAAGTAREIAVMSAERTPGSEEDAAVADLVTDRLSEIGSAEVSEQTFSGSFEGDDVELRNVIATLPGESERRLVVLAPRDSADGPGVASSAAATGVLLDVAETFGGASHSKTLVFVSTAGGTDGAIGAREFADHYPERDLVDAAIVISQPGASRPEPPYVIPWSAGPQSTAIQLTRTAADVVSAELGGPAGLPGTLGQLLRLALPSALGEQAPLIEDGIDAVAISSSGERPLAPAEDGAASLSETTLGEVGQAAQTVVLALDTLEGRPEHGPGAYVTVAGNLLPGWSIALLAIALMFPAAVAAGDGFARAVRRGSAHPLDLGWVVGRSLPFLGVLLLTYLLAVIGLLPRPSFPYDPGRFALDWRAAVVLLLLAGALAAAWAATRPLSVPRRADPEGLATAAGVVLCGGAVVLWLFNPFLALLAVPATHAWVAATARDPSLRLGLTVGAVALSLLPAVVALAWLAGTLEVGVTVPWQVLLMVGGWHLGPGVVLVGCLLAGALVALVAASRGPPRAAPEPRVSVRRPDADAGAASPKVRGERRRTPQTAKKGGGARRIFDVLSANALGPNSR